jgi:hypothetical protein
MSFGDYTNKKFQNLEIDWNTYKVLNPDLVKAGINTEYDIVKHWFNYGINENRKYTNENQDICCQWTEICGYLRNNNYISTNIAFVVTTCARTPIHLNYLTTCIKHIRAIYPNIYIYVINDNSTQNISVVNGVNIQIIPSLVSGGGEINPYLFILDPRCRHDKLVFIHDSAFIKCRIDNFINRRNDIDFIWYALKNIDSEMFNVENNEILDKFYIYCSNGKISIRNFIRRLKTHNKFYYVKFGSMSVFTKKFMEKVDLITNFRQVAHLFKVRVNRCLFERILSIVYIYIYGGDYNFNMCLCGDIFKHPKPFQNRAINIGVRYPIVKVWQGR